MANMTMQYQTSAIQRRLEGEQRIKIFKESMRTLCENYTCKDNTFTFSNGNDSVKEVVEGFIADYAVYDTIEEALMNFKAGDAIRIYEEDAQQKYAVGALVKNVYDIEKMKIIA